MYVLFLLTFIRLFSGCISGSLFSPCKVSDLTCIEKSANAALLQIFDGIPELGIESSDPQFNDIIEENLPMFKLSLFNTTLIGYKKCTISNLTFNEDLTVIHCNAICQEFVLSGKYEMKGRLITIPIEGNGDFTFTTGKFFLTIDTEVEKYKGDDGETHLVIKDIKINSKPLTPITFNFQNLFNGQKDLAEAVHKFSREHWLEVTEFVQYPIWYKALSKITKNVNKYLDVVAMEDILIN